MDHAARTSTMRAVPEEPRVATRFDRDRDSFTNYSDYLATDDARPQPKRDGAIGAARRLNRLQRHPESFSLSGARQRLAYRS
ncbi:hypothetical protein [Amycolatopsis sp. NPDC051128]|uniref:hypothetical protein n=1 Tax=Amycolatopsis sp. NPDC051128 TaxID=3155412 RepID=UPI00342EE6C8